MRDRADSNPIQRRLAVFAAGKGSGSNVVTPDENSDTAKGNVDAFPVMELHKRQNSKDEQICNNIKKLFVLMFILIS